MSVTGRKTRSIRSSRRKAASANGLRRTSSSASTRVPPKQRVEKISWKEKSKLTAQTWAVRSRQLPGRTRSCQVSRFTRAAWVITAPLGTPVDPEVKIA